MCNEVSLSVLPLHVDLEHATSLAKICCGSDFLGDEGIGCGTDGSITIDNVESTNVLLSFFSMFVFACSKDAAAFFLFMDDGGVSGTKAVDDSDTEAVVFE